MSSSSGDSVDDSNPSGPPQAGGGKKVPQGGTRWMPSLLRRFFSQPAGERNREYYEKLPLDSKRELYTCGSTYLTLDEIQTWEEFQKGKSRPRFKSPSPFPVVPTLNKKVSLWRGDITQLEIDAIVNAAKPSLLGGGGVDGAIHRAAGYSLRDECAMLGGCSTGDTKITSGHRLPAKYILHTVGPANGDEHKLRSCYATCLQLTLENNIQSVAFCCIATGVYGYPNKKAAHVALETTRNWLETNADKVDRVIFCTFQYIDYGIYQQLLHYYFPVEAPTDSDDHDDKLAEIDYTDLKFLDPLGEGGYGMVYKGIWKSRNKTVAIKKQNIINERELEILGSLHHPNFIQLYGVIMQTPFCFLVTELAENGSIFDYLHKKKQNPSLKQSLLWARQIAEGMNYLHQCGVIHRDLKSSNIVLSSDLIAKICDLGSARILQHTTHMTTAVGTYAWMSPEMFRREEVSKECDVYSYSILLWEIITHRVPFSDEAPYLVPVLVMDGKRPPVPDCDDYLQQLIQQCWNDKPKERPTFDSILLILRNKEFKKPLAEEEPSAKENTSTEENTEENLSMTLANETPSTEEKSLANENLSAEKPLVNEKPSVEEKPLANENLSAEEKPLVIEKPSVEEKS